MATERERSERKKSLKSVIEWEKVRKRWRNGDNER